MTGEEQLERVNALMSEIHRFVVTTAKLYIDLGLTLFLTVLMVIFALATVFKLDVACVVGATIIDALVVRFVVIKLLKRAFH